MTRRARAITLIEVMMACFLMTLLWLVLVAFLVAGKSLFTTSTERVSNLGTLAQLLERMEFDLNGAASDATLQTGGNYFGFQTCRDASGAFVTDASGHPVAQRWIQYYAYGKTILRREDPLSQYGLAWRAPRDGTGSVVAVSVSQFSVQDFENDISSSFDFDQVTLHITLDSFGGSGLEDSQDATRQILVPYIP